MPQNAIDKSPSAKTIEILNSLCRGKNNMVFTVSGKQGDTLDEWFSPCENLGIAAEQGYFLRLKRDTEWETLVAPADCSWKQIAEPVMKLYTETTDGSKIEDKETAMVWSYEDADPDFGSCQAKELLDHLESVLKCVNQSGFEYVKGGFNAICSDRSDEDMFEVITSAIPGSSFNFIFSQHSGSIFACTVGRKPSKAKYYLEFLIHNRTIFCNPFTFVLVTCSLCDNLDRELHIVAFLLPFFVVFLMLSINDSP